MTRALIAALLALLAPAVAHGAGEPPVARWRLGPDGAPRVVVALADALSDKQRSMIEGGFTTVSQLTLKLPITKEDEAREAELPVFYGLRCSVKFDAWEETFDVARLDDEPQAAMLKSFADYGDLCLRADLGGSALVARMAPSGGVLIAHLVVKQTSTEEAARIKDWLIQQQSGVMQGLFSHMLGELTLNHTIKVRIVVPPKPEGLERAAKPVPVPVPVPVPAPAPAPPVPETKPELKITTSPGKPKQKGQKQKPKNRKPGSGASKPASEGR